MNKKLKESGKRIQTLLEQIYKNQIAVRNGDSPDYSYDIEKKHFIVDIVVYLNYKMKIAVVWDNKYRRENGCTSHYFHWMQNIDSERIAQGFIDIGNKRFKTDHGLISERILIMSFDTLVDNLNALLDLFRPEELENEVLPQSNEKQVIRGRRTISQWNRDREFRSKVLRAFEGKCAICRCAEEKLLQAAHIIAVAAGGNDDVENGICLCANHHIMLDKQLIDIDYRKMRLSHISESVKSMPWYEAFIRNGNELVKRKKEY